MPGNGEEKGRESKPATPALVTLGAIIAVFLISEAIIGYAALQDAPAVVRFRSAARAARKVHTHAPAPTPAPASPERGASGPPPVPADTAMQRPAVVDSPIPGTNR